MSYSQLTVINISKPASPPETIFDYTPTATIRSVTVAGDEIYLSTEQAGLVVLQRRPRA
jgi:hypothetical protein